MVSTLKKRFLPACLCLFSALQLYAQPLQTAKGLSGEAYPSFTFDGMLGRFSTSAAVYFEGKQKRSYACWKDSFGDILVGYYDHTTRQTKTSVLFDQHARIVNKVHPALFVDKEGRLYVWFSEDSKTICLYSAAAAEEISGWQKIASLPDVLKTGDEVYLKGLFLAAEDSYFLFWEDAEGCAFSVSRDNTRSWSNAKYYLSGMDASQYSGKKTRIRSNGERIEIGIFDENNLYYIYYKNRVFYNARNRRLSSTPTSAQLKKLIVSNKEIDKRNQIVLWDIATGMDNKPVLVHSAQSAGKQHYQYTYRAGRNWKTIDLHTSLITDVVKKTSENVQLSGAAIDQEDPSQLYLSVKRDSFFEIERWTIAAEKVQQKEAITANSHKHNILPFTIDGYGSSKPSGVGWITPSQYEDRSPYYYAVKINLPPFETSVKTDSLSVVQLMQKVADWQLANPIKRDRTSWSWGVFFNGLMSLCKLTGDEKYLNYVINLGQQHEWSLTGDHFNADQMIIGQSYLDVYRVKRVPEMLRPVQETMNKYLARTDTPDIRHNQNPAYGKWWSWCDALYMAPPAFAKMYSLSGEEKYLHYMDENWWRTSAYLYSKEDSLFFRDDRYFNKRTENGKKTFWGRGNGWVIAGLARVIPYLPKQYKSREQYIEQFKQMAYKFRSLQQPHGLWTASLTDPEQLPTGESSGSALVTFALIWGVNQGILPGQDFKQSIDKAWKALVANINEEGRLGYVQPVAGSPFPFYAHQWQVYASGAFLLAAEQMIEMTRKKNNAVYD